MHIEIKVKVKKLLNGTQVITSVRHRNMISSFLLTYLKKKNSEGKSARKFRFINECSIIGLLVDDVVFQPKMKYLSQMQQSK